MRETTDTNPQRLGRLPGLDGLRAISILLVLLVHLHFWGPIASIPGLDAVAARGGFGVSIFFTISGFLITWLMIAEERRSDAAGGPGRVSLRNFYGRRAVRILPAALFYLAIIQIVLVSNGTANWPRWLSSVLFCRNLLHTEPYRVGFVDTAHFWSLSVEEQFYFIWPLAFLLTPRRLRLPVLTICFLALPFWRQANFIAFGAPNVNPNRADLMCDGLLAGCILACTVESPRIDQCLARPIARATLTLLLVIAILVLSLTPRAETLPVVLRVGLPTVRALGVAALINGLIRRHRREDVVFRTMNCGPMRFVGGLSYSLYLWQQPFCMPTGALAGGGRPFSVVATVVCAMLSHYLIERPALRCRRYFGSLIDRRRAESGSITADTAAVDTVKAS